jgi:tRNA modification GTPase
MYIEAAIDFPDEEVDFLADEHIAESLAELQQRLQTLRTGAGQGQLLRDGMRVVIVGQPNAGKSSLLNQLSGRETAIVTAIPGTTRDVLREQIAIDGMPLHIIDTAGLRDSTDPVEQEGIRRAWREIETADRVLLMVDDRQGLTNAEQQWQAKLPASAAVTIIRNKIDLTGTAAGVMETEAGLEVRISAKTGAGLEALRGHLKACMGYQAQQEGVFMARRRHLQALDSAMENLVQAAYQLETVQAGELVAEELRLAQQALGEITGEFTSEDLLGRIFTSFCIGK